VREGRVEKEKSTKKSTNIQKEERRSCSLIDSFLSSNGTALSRFQKRSRYSKFKKTLDCSYRSCNCCCGRVLF